MDDKDRAILSELVGLITHFGPYKVESLGAGAIRVTLSERSTHSYEGKDDVVELSPGDTLDLRVMTE
jgi:hypothetical protein